jgi:oxygen-independent coproporphyrinogen-3 oxidase
LAFGIYVHVPYCLQLCPYCDFTKYEVGKTLAPERYVELVRKEIRQRGPEGIREKEVSTIYFGGGTPSLLEPSLILSLIDEVANAGFRLKGPEISIEIDPATVDEARLDQYLAGGVTRFSVGAQSFNDRLLKIAGRKHTSKDTVELLDLLKRRKVNYSFDLLFALPSQTLQELNDDVEKAIAFGPSHLSAYNLTVPEGHKLDAGRAPEGEQIAMFDLIEEKLGRAGIERYEISNFAKPGFESKHNSLYWQDQPYWGVGLSSHSFLTPAALPEEDAAKAPLGVRFWNRRAMKEYEKEISTNMGSWSFVTDLADAQKEILKEHQAMTDFLGTSFRPLKGLAENALRLKFSPSSVARAIERIDEIVTYGWATKTNEGWALTREGRLLANQAFEKLTFLQGELS